MSESLCPNLTVQEVIFVSKHAIFEPPKAIRWAPPSRVVHCFVQSGSVEENTKMHVLWVVSWAVCLHAASKMFL